MTEMDLIPELYRTRLIRLRYIRQFTIALVLVFVSNILVFAIFSLLTNSIHQDLALLQEQKNMHDAQKSELDALTQQFSEYSGQWNLLNTLRGEMPAKNIFETIDNTLGDNDIWFLDLKFYRNNTLVAKQEDSVNTGYFVVVPAGQQQSQIENWHEMPHMTIKGLAKDHEALSKFVQRLFNQSKVSDVRIINTMLRKLSSTEIVDFDVVVIIDAA